jgi:transcriptional regulator with XRE-family HTH domain
VVDDTGGDADKLKKPLGATGETVRANITRLRTEQRMAYTDLSAKLKDLDRPIPPLGLRRIENGARRVDADDLFALAVALGVSPVTLLTPNAAAGSERVAATGVPKGLQAEQLWRWLCVYEPIGPEQQTRFAPGRLNPEQTVDFQMAALPLWKKREMAARIEVAKDPFGYVQTEEAE